MTQCTNIPRTSLKLQKPEGAQVEQMLTAADLANRGDMGAFYLRAVLVTPGEEQLFLNDPTFTFF